MLDEVNRLLHGYVAVPITVACNRRGAFETLALRGPLSLQDLASGLRANPGPLAVAVRMFRSLGWLSRDASGLLSVTASAKAVDLIPAGAASLYTIDFPAALRGSEEPGPLAEWIGRCASGWRIDDPDLAGLLDGTMVVPLLLAMRSGGMLDDGGVAHFDRIDPALRDPVASLMRAKEWTGSDGRPTAKGRFFAERAPVMATTASYRPMLREMPELLFGDPRRVFDRDAEGHERHVDRTLNVIGSGFQHERFFADLDAAMVRIFDDPDIARQPRWVADMGCGDGTLLARIWTVVRERTRRGGALDAAPLVMIGLDANARSLEATAATLAEEGVPHLVALGDIGNPEALTAELARLGVSDPTAVLHVRSFLDHDRPFRPPTDLAAVAERRRHRLGGVHIDRDGGLIEPAAAVQSLVEHLGRWSRIADGHGLLLLEVHSLPPEIVARYRDLAENLHFDAYHAFSRQYLVEAGTFLLTLAEVGLFARRGHFLRYPRSLPFTRITAGWYERRPYRLRHPRPSDLPELLALEDACWSAPLRLSAPALAQRIDGDPAAHFVLELNGRIVAAIYTQRIASVEQLRGARFADLAALVVPDGPVIQLLGMSVLPDMQDRGLGDQLLDFVLQYATVCAGVEAVAGITRCRDWHLRHPLPLAEYLARTDGDGLVEDPVPRFHQAHGARLLGIVEGYRPEDADNDGAGVLITYDLQGSDSVGCGGAGSAGVDADPAAVVEEAVRRLLGTRGEGRYSPDRALRDIGLDSLDLMELRVLLGRAFGIEIPSSFFFRNPTPAAIARSLAAPTGVAPLRRAAVPNKARSQPAAVSPDSGPIAVIGMACRFPGGASDPDAFWTVLRDGIDCMDEVPPLRWDSDALTAAAPGTPGRINSRYGGFIDDIDRFDAAFFGIGRREAMMLDPQQRLLLEASWEALERAGIDPRRLAGGQVGVYIGQIAHDYETLQVRSRSLREHGIYLCTGSANSVAAGRLAYFYDFKGPAISVDTACSSSLVSVHLACQALRTGEIDMALAAGVHLMLTPEPSVAYSQVRMLAPDGRCKAFDASADGYGRGEGCGVLVLKPLARAREDGDIVLGVIRGSALNQDGAGNGLTAPNGAAQAALIRRALQTAATSPGEIGFVECHGTGTALGDPVEVSALADVFAGRSTPLALGTVKTNIGHAEGAAGVAGLIKAILAVRRGAIPPNLHFQTLNPEIDLASMNAVIPTELSTWPPGPRVAGVSSFGLSGTNAHAVVAEAPPEPPLEAVANPRPVEVYPLSAATREALADLANRHAAALEDGIPFRDAAHTARVGRAALRYRTAIVAADGDEAATLLRMGGRTGEAPEIQPKVAFLFTGQGSQYVDMARSLYETEPVVADILDRCDEALAARRPGPARLLDVLFGEAGAALDRTEWTQPALYAVGCALAALWRYWGVEPMAVVGHSVGDYAAAWVAGMFDLEDGLRLIADRADLMQALPAGGAMMAVAASPETVAAALAETAGPVAVAAWNGPGQAVLSGASEAVEAVLARLPEARPVRLPVSHAFHSPLMDPVMEPFRRRVASMRLRPPDRPLVSGLTGAPAGDDAVQADWWVRHLREPVRFADSLACLDRLGAAVMIEIGPAPVLTGFAQRTGIKAGLIASLVPGRDERGCLMEALADAHVAGLRVDWQAVDQAYGYRRAILPTYPFQRESYWLPASAEARAETGHPLLGRRLSLAVHDTVYEAKLAGRTLERLRGADAPACFLDLALAAAGQHWPGRTVAVSGLELTASLPAGDDVVIQTVVDANGGLTVSARSGGDRWSVVATANLAVDDLAGIEPVGHAG